MILTLTLFACVIGGGKTDDSGVGNGDDTGGGGGNTGDDWRARGKGEAWLLDGEQDNSRFSLEVASASEPEEGKHYYGFLMDSKGGIISLGEITVSNDTVLFERELGVNGFTAGYTRFEAWQAESQPAAPGTGDPVWEGELAGDALTVLEELLLSSPDSPTGEGSLRAVETTVETLRDYGQASIDGFTDVNGIRDAGERVYNGVTGENTDLDDSGVANTVPGPVLSLVGPDGHTERVFADLTDALEAFGGVQNAPDEVRAALDDAYDCIQNVETLGATAANKANAVTVCAAESTCLSLMGNAVSALDQTLVGEDINEDGVITDTEGTVECAIEHVSKMAGFEIEVPK